MTVQYTPYRHSAKAWLNRGQIAGIRFEALRGRTRVSADPDLAALLTIKGPVGAAFLGHFFWLLKRSGSRAYSRFTTEASNILRTKLLHHTEKFITHEIATLRSVTAPALL